MHPSEYKLNVNMGGFRNYEQSGITVLADQSLTLNVTLQIGATTETITVEAATAQINTTTGGVSQVIGQQQVNELPLNGRNAAALTTLVAGVVLAPNAQADQGNTKTFPEAVTIAANGTRVGQTNYLLDGGNNVDEYTNVNAPFPMPDAIQEFSVATSNYNAEYGQNAGGVVNIITKSGGNHITAIFSSSSATAPSTLPTTSATSTASRQSILSNATSLAAPLAVRSQIPGLFKTKHTFFFFGYQKTIAHTASVSATASTLPTTAQLAGSSTSPPPPPPAPRPSIAPASQIPRSPPPTSNASQCYPYTSNGGTSYTAQIPTDTFNSASLALLKYLPTPNAAGSYTYVQPSFTTLGEITARFDQDLGAQDRLTARYFSDGYHLDGVLNLQNLLTYADQASIHYYNALVSETHTFSDRILNNFILSYQLEDSNRGPLPGSINVNDLGVNIWQPAFKQINQIAVTNFFTIGGNPQADFARANYTLANDLHVHSAITTSASASTARSRRSM